MKKVSLSKAMKLKSRLAGKLAQIENRIKESNVIIVGNQRDCDVEKLLERRNFLADCLVALKTNICKANDGQQYTLELLREKQAQSAFLKSIDTRCGIVKENWNSEVVEYNAKISRVDIDNLQAELQEKIDELQDSIDAYNAVPDRVDIMDNLEELIHQPAS